jgi:RNA polymerase sigma-70 factor, ECF subfamily
LSPSDEELARLVAEGDLDAFGQLYDRYSQRVHSWSIHVVGADRAEDVIQDLFLRLWARAGQFDPGRGSFAAWFMAITRHHLIGELRKRSLRERVRVATEIEAVLSRAPADEPDPAEYAAMRESGEELAGALRDLPREQRDALVLAYFAGLSQSAIARELGIPLGTVKKRMRLGMQKLKARLAGHGDPKSGQETRA